LTRDHGKHIYSFSGLKQEKALMQWPSAKKNKETVKTEQKPAMMAGRTADRTLSPKRPPFQMGLVNSSGCEGAQK
jgi:hypothetical protein